VLLPTSSTVLAYSRPLADHVLGMHFQSYGKSGMVSIKRAL
jgi:hypothetical protein